MGVNVQRSRSRRNLTVPLGVAAMVGLTALGCAYRTGTGGAGTSDAPAPLSQETGSAKAPSMFDDPRHYELRELSNLGFLVPGAALLIGTGRTSPPTHALFLRHGGQLSRVRGPDDLGGHVSIRSEENALQYARLFSSVVMPVNVSDTVWREVLRVSALSRELFFGSDAFHQTTPDDVRSQGEKLGGRPDWRFYGIILDDEWKSNGLSEPSVQRTEEGFVVAMWLWTADRKMGARLSKGDYLETDAVYLVARTVSPEGSITEEILEKKELRGIVLAYRPKRY